MNLRALIIVEDLHRELIDLDGRIAESHAVLFIGAFSVLKK